MTLLNMVMKIVGISSDKNKRVERGLCSNISQETNTAHNVGLENANTLIKDLVPFSRLHHVIVRYPLSISRLKKLIKEKDVVKDIFRTISEHEDGFWEYEVGDNTEHSSTSMLKYRLIIRDRKIKLVVNELRVIEFY
ncbi:hypothetical protein [Paenibacillus sp. FSL K6-2859]|uniref:hypothetical protein n=1 Tax=Paenibacillus sp. FSL K6-2859 TaxID=2921482 RepID=UPI0030F6B90B